MGTLGNVWHCVFWDGNEFVSPHPIAVYLRFQSHYRMRLAQLARKISVTPAEIVRFLQINGESTADVNSRLTEQQLRAILSHLAPGRVDEILEQDKTNAESEQPEIVQIQQEVINKLEDALSIQPELLIEKTQEPPLLIENSEEIVLEGEETKNPFEGVDLIKAPKVTLTGLKVVGKIDLPEPKKKEPEIKPIEEIESEIKETATPQISKKIGKGSNKFSERRERSERPRRNPVALQREREAREAEERKKEEIRREKERRTQYYNSRVKQGAPKRAARLIDEPLEALHEIKEEPKTIWGKIWRWLTT